MALAALLAACAAPGAPDGEGAPVVTPDAQDTTTPSAIADDAGFAPKPGRAAVVSSRHMAAAANPHAATAGREILRQGGNAVDAAIAMAMVLNVVEPQSSGIGGGGFLLNFNGKTGAMAAYEGREAAPGATTEDMFMDTNGEALPRSRYRVGATAAAVPGALRMYEEAHRRHGKLPWARLFEPAIRIATDGFKVSERLHRSIARDRYLSEYPAARAHFFDAAGDPLAIGTVLRNPALAQVMSKVARRGAGAFYKGDIARDMVRAVAADKTRPGHLALTDIAAYRAKTRHVVCSPYRVWLICGFGPPTSGGLTVLMTLSLLEHYDLAGLKPGSAEAVHLISEASRLAWADRLKYIADPDHVDVPVKGLLDKRYLRRRAEDIRRDRALEKVRAGRPPGTERRAQAPAASGDWEQPSTTHINVVDSQGNAVALTASVGGAFGSRIMVRGFMLNNHSSDFSPVPRTAKGTPKINRPGPNKRPRSSQAPTFVFDGSGKLVLAVGSPGGTRIIGYVVKTIIGVLDWKLDIQKAINLPHHVARSGDRIDLESGTSLEVIAEPLRALGHRVRMRRLTSGIQGIALKGGKLMGGADPRREGMALGD